MNKIGETYPLSVFDDLEKNKSFFQRNETFAIALIKNYLLGQTWAEYNNIVIYNFLRSN